MKTEIIYWRMRNGKLINVDDMDDNHVRNAFKMLLRNLQKLQQNNSKQVTKETFTLNGDMAQFFNEEQNNSIQNDYYESESYLGYRFHDDECRGNQWD